MDVQNQIYPNSSYVGTTTYPGTETETVTVEECSYDKNGKLVKRTVTTTTKYRSRGGYQWSPTVWYSTQ